MSIWKDLVGTTRSYFRIGFQGVRLKNSGGNLAVRNSGDTADAELTASKVNVSGDSLDINSDAAGSGNDWKLTLQRNAAQSQALTLVPPAAKGTDGYLLRQKPGTASGVLELELVAPTSTSAQVTVETTTLAFGSSSPLPLFTKSGTAVIDKIQIVIDTAFNGTPSVSIGVAGQTSKYAAATDIDLTQPAGTVIELSPGVAATGSSEDLIATYAASGASAGSARIIVYYADAPV